MLDMTWKDGTVTVVACKSKPGIAMYLTKGGKSGSVFFPDSGIGVQIFKSDDPPIRSLWLPMLTGLGPIEARLEVAKAEKKLREGEHRTAPGEAGYPKEKREYAVPEKYVFPIDDEKHVHAAIAYFHKHSFKSAAEKRSAAKRILSAARKHGVEVSKDLDVCKAARSA